MRFLSMNSSAHSRPRVRIRSTTDAIRLGSLLFLSDWLRPASVLLVDFVFLPGWYDELGMLATVPIVTRLAALASWRRADGTCWPTVWLDWIIFIIPECWFFTCSPPKSVNLSNVHSNSCGCSSKDSFGDDKPSTCDVCRPNGRSRGRCRLRKRLFGRRWPFSRDGPTVGRHWQRDPDAGALWCWDASTPTVVSCRGYWYWDPSPLLYRVE